MRKRYNYNQSDSDNDFVIAWSVWAFFNLMLFIALLAMNIKDEGKSVTIWLLWIGSCILCIRWGIRRGKKSH